MVPCQHGATAVNFAYAGGVYRLGSPNANQDLWNRVCLVPRFQAPTVTWHHYIDGATGTVVGYHAARRDRGQQRALRRGAQPEPRPRVPGAAQPFKPKSGWRAVLPPANKAIPFRDLPPTP